MAPTPSLLSAGLIVADTYEVVELLGRGGMGEVWLARHRRLAGKQVALKVLHTDTTLSPEALKRFEREAQIAVRLEHPNIVQVLDFNTLATGEPFFAMEYLKGESLGARLARGPMPLDEAIKVVLQVGSALQLAHHGGVVHRDLKPENIFLTPTALGSQVKVLDFGISKLPNSSSLKTTDSALIGTPLYMSPEQAVGKNDEITAQSDLFSLGSIVYEMLTQLAPFSAENVAKVVFRIAFDAHRSLVSAAPQLPANVVDAVEHALQKDKARRTPDIETFVFELTGQRLAEAPEPSLHRAPLSDVLATPSMLGPTVTPGLAKKNLTPAEQLPQSPPALSRRRLLASVFGAFTAVGVVALFTVPMLRPEAPRPAASPWASSKEPGTPAPTAVRFEADAGEEPTIAVRAEADASEQPVIPSTHERRPPPPPERTQVEVVSDDDQQRLNQLLEAEAAGDWERMKNLQGSLPVAASAKRDAVKALFRAACHLKDQSMANIQLGRLTILNVSTKPLLTECRRVYPTFEAP